MTISPTTLGRTADTLRSAAEEAQAAYTDLNAQLMSAKHYENGALLPSELRTERESRIERVRQAAAKQRTTLQARAESAAVFVRSAAEQERPRITDYAQAQAAWAQAQMYLNNGHSLWHVLANADQAMTLAVEEYGVHWLQAQRDPAKLTELRFSTYADVATAAVEQLRSTVLERLADLTPDLILADALRFAGEVDNHLTAARAWWDGLSAVAANREAPPQPPACCTTLQRADPRDGIDSAAPLASGWRRCAVLAP